MVGNSKDKSKVRVGESEKGSIHGARKESTDSRLFKFLDMDAGGEI